MERNKTERRACKTCSIPITVRVGNGVARIATSKITNTLIRLSIYLSSRRYETNTVSVPKITSSVRGHQSLTPNKRYTPASSSVQSGEEVEEVNSYLVVPQTWCATTFLATAM